MTNEKYDPWALLREAREVVHADVTAARSIAYAQWSPEQHRAEVLRDRIDAALAAHASRQIPTGIRWEEKDSNRHGISPHQADYSDDVFLTAEQHWLNGEWLWRVERAGYAKDEADAKAKAIEYAGRLP